MGGVKGMGGHKMILSQDLKMKSGGESDRLVEEMDDRFSSRGWSQYQW